MEDSYNDGLFTINDEFDTAYASWMGNNDLTNEAKRRGAMECIDRAEELYAADEQAFDTTLEDERQLYTGQLEAALEQHAPQHTGPDAVASMMAAQAAVSSGDARLIMEAHRDALRVGNEAALSILETAGPAAMPEGLRKEFKDRISEAQTGRKHPVIKEREKALADFEKRADRAEFARAMMRTTFTNKLREYKRP